MANNIEIVFLAIFPKKFIKEKLILLNKNHRIEKMQFNQISWKFQFKQNNLFRIKVIVADRMASHQMMLQLKRYDEGIICQKEMFIYIYQRIEQRLINDKETIITMQQQNLHQYCIQDFIFNLKVQNKIKSFRQILIYEQMHNIIDFQILIQKEIENDFFYFDPYDKFCSNFVMSYKIFIMKKKIKEYNYYHDPIIPNVQIKNTFNANRRKVYIRIIIVEFQINIIKSNSFCNTHLRKSNNIILIEKFYDLVVWINIQYHQRISIFFADSHVLIDRYTEEHFYPLELMNTSFKINFFSEIVDMFQVYYDYSVISQCDQLLFLRYDDYEEVQKEQNCLAKIFLG